MVTPILIRSFGRSGSTLMMQVLGSSENVLFDREYPFEKRYLTYLHRLSNVVNQPFADNDEWNADVLFESNNSMIGPFPYTETDLFDKNELPGDFLMRLWDGFSYQLIKFNSGKFDNSRPIYYAEKVAQDVCVDINHFTSCKNLFLFRDPRDEFLSIKSFNHKRGFNGFDWSKDDTDESFARKLCSMRRSFMHHLLHIDNDDQRLVVFYERFIENPVGSTKLISDWLGIELSYHLVENQHPMVADHMTSLSVNDSIYRWKSELSSDIQAIFAKELGEELESLGYEVP